MAPAPTFHPVYRSVNKPLTICGADRRLFFLALIIGATTFNFFGSLLAGIVMGAALAVGARWLTGRDLQLLRVLLNSARVRRQYDPAKLEYVTPPSASTRPGACLPSRPAQ
jgi:type IV secretory pathway TrbD component